MFPVLASRRLPDPISGVVRVEKLLRVLEQRWDERPFLWLSAERDLPRGAVALPVPTSARVLALAPHPDDPETSAVALRLLREAGCDLRYAVVCLSPRGVQDSYVIEETDELNGRKEAVRTGEQRAAASLLGLPPENLTFLRLPEGELLASAENRARVESHLEAVAPDIVVLPTGKDRNRTHAWVCTTFRAAAPRLARKLDRPIVALYNEDPKTVSLRDDLFVPFDEERALWKRRLLRCHDSQQQRNLTTRGCGFDERIIEVSRDARRRVPAEPGRALEWAGYAEAFEIEVFRPKPDLGGI